MRAPTISVQNYVPNDVPSDPKEIQRYLIDEFRRISDAMGLLAAGHSPIVYVAPDKPREGDIRYADGTSWNPGSGQGIYAYIDGDWRLMSFGDLVTTIDIVHKRVHDGDGFNLDVYSTVTNGTPKYCQFETGAKYVHLHVSRIADGTDTLLCEFFEEPTLTDGTTSVPIYNQNRNSSTATTVTAYSDPTSVISDGTKLITNYLAGTNQAAGGAVTNEIEWLLKPNTTYLHKMQNLSAGTATFSVKMFWYETTSVPV